MDYRSFVTLFKQSTTLKNILKDNDVIVMYIIGSQMLELQDDNSNYNIVVLVNDVTDRKNEFIKINTIEIQIQFINWFNLTHALIDNWVGYELCITSDADILYKNVNHQDLLKSFQQEKGFWRKTFIWNFILEYQNQIRGINNFETLISVLTKKELYYLCFSSDKIWNNQIDRTLLLKIKRDQELTEKDKKRILAKIHNLYTLVQYYYNNSQIIFKEV